VLALAFINLALKFPGFVIPANAGATIFKGRVNKKINNRRDRLTAAVASGNR
jgi:hypothetical protein